MPDIKLLTPDEWFKLRDIRLSALRESPDAFLATYEQEEKYNESQWRAEFDRGEWNIGLLEGNPVSLLGVTCEPGTPAGACYFEYLWVSPECRRSGVASSMLTVIFGRLRHSGTATVFLWLLDGNEVAMNFYNTVGFARINHHQPLPERPGRSEELMRLDLG
jgi:ribosomal protein S18 acetylase RimI-like enzyme